MGQECQNMHMAGLCRLASTVLSLGPAQWGSEVGGCSFWARSVTRAGSVLGLGVSLNPSTLDPEILGYISYGLLVPPDLRCVVPEPNARPASRHGRLVQDPGARHLN